jgi:hypothetical protein
VEGKQNFVNKNKLLNEKEETAHLQTEKKGYKN